MEVDEDDSRSLAQTIDLAEHDAERIVDVEHEHPAHEADYADRSAVARTCEVTAIARHAGRVVGRPQETRLGSDVVERLLLVPDVIARGHHVDAEVEDLLANLARDTETAGRVLRVGNDEVDLMALDEAGQALTQQITSRFADDIADEEQPHEWPIG